MKFFKKLRIFSNQAGATLTEFAILAPVSFMILLGIVESGRIYWFNNSLQFAVNAAGRYLMVNTSATNYQVTSAVSSNLGVAPNNLVVTVTSSTASGITYKTISATMSASFITGVMPNGALTLSAQNTVPILP